MRSKDKSACRALAAGNIYRHEYEVIQEIEIWNTVVFDLPPLLAVVEKELKIVSMQKTQP